MTYLEALNHRMWAVWPNRIDDIKCIEDDSDDIEWAPFHKRAVGEKYNFLNGSISRTY
jgi:hypothetical protein